MWFPLTFIVVLLGSVPGGITESRLLSALTGCKIIRGSCPHNNVSFWLYSRDTIEQPQKLDPLNLNRSAFPANSSVHILLHGYTGHRDFAPNNYIRPQLLADKTANRLVISMDYGPLVPNPCYITAVQNLPLAAQCLGQLVNNLIDGGFVRPENLHLIGFSLGAQVAGQTANYVKRKLKHITGLDPAKPLFITVGPDRRLDAEDAEFVDVIHTDVLGRGMIRNMGHADFYANIGSAQPGCETTFNVGRCNHDRAPQYYAESINTKKGFWAYNCRSWMHKVLGFCTTHSNDQLMGFHVNHSLRGSYFLETAREPPFALGQQTGHRTNVPELNLNSENFIESSGSSNDLEFQYSDVNPFEDDNEI